MTERERMEAGEHPAPARRRAVLITALGVVQILMWGSTFYLLAVLAPAIVAETGWPSRWVIGGITIGLITAGLISPRVGRVIDRRGGRPVLVFSPIVTACGFVALALAWSLPAYLPAWVVLGIGMGAGLTDAVFAALGRLYGADARGAITSLTLFGGFGSTVCWPLSAWLLATWDWRVTCLVYAGIHLVVSLPIHALLFPAAAPPAQRRAAETVQPPAPVPALSSAERVVFGLLAGVQMLAQAIGAIVIVYLLVFLQARGLTLTAAVALGTLFGPAQVGARVIERMFGARYHPIWTMIAAAALMTLGLALLLVDLPCRSGRRGGLRRRLRRYLDRARHAAARAVRAGALPGADRPPGVAEHHRAGARAGRRRADDRAHRHLCDHRGADRGRTRQCRAGRRAVAREPAAAPPAAERRDAQQRVRMAR